jgi:phosphoglycerate dehydrogenase-like enzyme
MRRVNGIYVLDAASYGLIYGPEQRRAIEACARLVATPQTAESIAARPELLADVEVIFSGWGIPIVNDAFLDRAPHLRAIFYGAGAIGHWATDAIWRRGITVTTATLANAVPVAEYTLGMILLTLKHAFLLARPGDARPVRWGDAPGNYRRTVGLVSFGAIAQALVERLKPFDLDVLVYDPFLSAEQASRAGVARASMEELFARCDVVSLHAPLLPETRGLITGAHLAALRPGAAFINTARGAIVRQDELFDVARRRPDVQFVLDVTTPDPLPDDAPLRALPNVLVTPHIAGSTGQECQRMGAAMVEELERYVAGRPLRWAVSREMAQHSAHRPGAAAAVA